jgi:hypothetical protein
MSDVTNFVYVTIKSTGRIPFLNRSGPVSRPISIAKAVYDTLKSLGYEMTVHEKENVSVDSVTGVRVAITADNFVPHTEGTYIDVDTTEPSPALVPPTMNEVTVDEPKQLDGIPEPEVEETDVDGTEEDTEEEGEESVEDADTDPEAGIDVYDMEVYKTYTKAQLVTYLRKAEEYLSDEAIAELPSANKVRLLEIVEKEIVNAAE